MKKIFTLLSLVLIANVGLAQKTSQLDLQKAFNGNISKLKSINPIQHPKTATCADTVSKFFDRTTGLSSPWPTLFGDAQAQVIPFSGVGTVNSVIFSLFSDDSWTGGADQTDLAFKVAIYNVDASGVPSTLIAEESFTYSENTTANPNGLIITEFTTPVNVTNDYAVLLFNEDNTRDIRFCLNAQGNGAGEGLSFDYYIGNFDNYLTMYNRNRDLLVIPCVSINLTADFNLSLGSTTTGTPVTFTSTTDIDSLGYHNDYVAQGNTMFSWNFDDGNTASVAQTSHSFANCGTYDVQLTASYTSYANNNLVCTDTKTMTVTVQDDIQMAGTPTTTTACGASDGAVNLTSTVGSNAGTLAWTGTATSSATGITLPYDVTGLAAGTYNFTLTDAKNCTSQVASITVADQGAPTIGASQDDPILCNGGQTTATIAAVTGDISGFTFTWTKAGNTVGTGTNASALTAGLYDINGTNGSCNTSTSITISEPTVLAATATPTNITCNGLTNGSVAINSNGGTAPYATSGASLTNLAAGTYNYVVTDDNGCTVNVSATITEPTALAVSNTASNVLCKGASTGVVNLTIAGGTPSYSTAPSTTALAAGTYTFTVTDDNGCTATTNATITEPATAVAITSGVVSNVTNTTTPDGGVNVMANGGTGTLTYAWANATTPATVIATTEDLSNVAAGTYVLTVTDANGCTATATYTIISVAGINDLTINDLKVYPNPVSGVLNVEATNIKEVQVLDMFGKLILTNEVNANAKSIDLSAFANGAYFVKIITNDAQQVVKINLNK